MDNEKLAKAIAGLYALTGLNEWDDTDEELQAAAFTLYEKAGVHPVDFAVLLVKNGMAIEDALNFCEVTDREYSYAASKPF